MSHRMDVVETNIRHLPIQNQNVALEKRFVSRNVRGRRDGYPVERLGTLDTTYSYSFMYCLISFKATAYSTLSREKDS